MPSVAPDKGVEVSVERQQCRSEGENVGRGMVRVLDMVGLLVKVSRE